MNPEFDLVFEEGTIFEEDMTGVFFGKPDDVRRWFQCQKIGETVDLNVLIGKTSKIVTVPEYMRSRVSISEDDVRRIVREELKSLMESLEKSAAAGVGGSESDDMESAANGAISSVMRLEASLLPHAWNCTLRNPRVWPSKCTCGADEK